MNIVIKGILDDLMVHKKISKEEAAFHIDQLGLSREKIDKDMEEYFAAMEG